LKYADCNRIGSNDDGIRKVVTVHLYEFFTESASVLYGERSFFQDETVDVKSETY